MIYSPRNKYWKGFTIFRTCLLKSYILSRRYFTPWLIRSLKISRGVPESTAVCRVVHQRLTEGGRTSRQRLTPREIESKGPSVPLYTPILPTKLQGGRKSSPRYIYNVR